MRNNYWHQKTHSKYFYFLNVTQRDNKTRQATLHSLIKNKIANAKQYRGRTKICV